MFQDIVLSVVIVPIGLALHLEADAELDSVLGRDVAGQLQDKCKSVAVLAAVHIVQEGAFNVSETDPRVKGGTHLNRLLKADVADFDGAGK